MGWIVLIIVVVSIAVPVLQVDDWSRDWTTNHAELEDTADNPDLQPIQWVGNMDDAVETICQWVENQPAWKTGAISGEENTSVIALTRTTPICRFVDDITIRIRPLRENAGDLTNDTSAVGKLLLEASSQSRVGVGDLGQNKRNLIELVQGIRGSLAQQTTR